jgi:hypothetical protein
VEAFKPRQWVRMLAVINVNRRSSYDGEDDSVLATYQRLINFSVRLLIDCFPSITSPSHDFIENRRAAYSNRWFLKTSERYHRVGHVVARENMRTEGSLDLDGTRALGWSKEPRRSDE